MRRVLHLGFLSTILVSATTVTNAQKDEFAYVITDAVQEGSAWNSLRKLDLKTGEYSDVLIKATDPKSMVFDALSRKQLVQQSDAKYGTALQAPFSTGVAAAAYDKRNNRLYFTPMFIDQLRYIDLKTMKVYYVNDQSLTGLGSMHNDEGKCVTRMVIAPDGNGYAITNDGNTIVKFSTGRKVKIENLGSLVDDPSNNGVSIHNRCTSFGGDMIADDKGSLFIISARNHVFEITTETKVAKFIGAIKGLPATFTSNGAVVDGDGNLLVSSAVDGKAYFVVNPKTWEASAYQTSKAIFRSSDLANSNFLSTGTKSDNTITTTEPLKNNIATGAKLIHVYPNPVTASQFTIQFTKVPAGEYTMEMTDVMGRTIMQKRITVGYEGQTQLVPLSSGNTKGIYLVKVLDAAKTSVFEQKLMIQ